MPFDLNAVQAALQQARLDGWLLYDFRGINPLAVDVLELPPAGHRSRRWFYYIPAVGTPRKLVHRIESGALDTLPGTPALYTRWQELEQGLENLLAGSQRVAMEYAPRAGNPYVSRVDAGTVELVRENGCEVISSGDLIQQFQATLTDAQIAQHFAAEKITTSAYDKVIQLISSEISANGSLQETAVRDAILDHFRTHGAVTDHAPIVGVGRNAGLPHYESGTGENTTIRRGDLLLVDLWARTDDRNGIYSDLTRMFFIGKTVPDREANVFAVVAAARDAGIERVQTAFARGEPLAGWQVDRATRNVIESTGYGDYFTHRTGHSIGISTHGNGTHMDDWETHDERKLLPRTLFSIEPGIYLPEFGVRSEINVLIEPAGTVRVTGGPLQTRIALIDV